MKPTQLLNLISASLGKLTKEQWQRANSEDVMVELLEDRDHCCVGIVLKAGGWELTIPIRPEHN